MLAGEILVDEFGVDPSRASFMLLPVVLATAFGSPIVGRLLDKIGSKIIINTGLIVTALALFLLSFLTSNTLVFYTAGGLLGLGLSMRASLNFIMLNEVPARERAATQGVLLIFISMGQLTGAALVGAIASSTPGHTQGYGYSFMAMTGLAAILMVLSFFLKGRKQEMEGNK